MSALTSSEANVPARTTRANAAKPASSENTAVPSPVLTAQCSPALNSDACSGSTNATPSASPRAMAASTSASASGPKTTGSTASAAGFFTGSRPTSLSTRDRCALNRTFPNASVTASGLNDGKLHASRSSGKSRSRTMVATFRLRNAMSLFSTMRSFCLPLSSSTCS